MVPKGRRMIAKLLVLKAENEAKIDKAWAEGGGQDLLEIPAIEIKMKPGIPPVRIKQCPISAEGKQGLIPIIKGLLRDGILEPCMSPHNTPTLLVKKSNGSYQFVQDLREISRQSLGIQ